MLWFLVGIIIVIVLCWIFAEKALDTPFLIPLALLIVVILGIIPPVCIHAGYEEKELASTIELVSLGTDITSVGSGNRRYVTVSGEKVYTYRYKVKNTSGLEGTMYKTETISGNVQEVESLECKNPMLYIYKEKNKNSIWFSYNIGDRYTYIFYVPEGTIVRAVTLD